MGFEAQAAHPIQTKSVYPSQVFYANFQDVCKATDIPLG